MDDARQGEDHADESQQMRALLRRETAVDVSALVAGGQIEEDLHHTGQRHDAESHHGHAGELPRVASEAIACLYQQHVLVIQ